MQGALKLGAILIGTYLVVYYATGAGRVIGAGATGGSQVIRAFQGR
jgi:hypothetical protein